MSIWLFGGLGHIRFWPNGHRILLIITTLETCRMSHSRSLKGMHQELRNRNHPYNSKMYFFRDSFNGMFNFFLNL